MRAGLTRAGLIFVLVLLVALAFGFPTLAWLIRGNNGNFKTAVDWATILGLPLAAMLGLIGPIVGKLREQSVLSIEKLSRIANEISTEVLHRESFLLSQLLATNSPDRRPAAIGFLPTNTSRRRKKAGRRSTQRKQYDISDITAFFLNKTAKRMVVLGASGSGKTVLAVSLIIGLIKRTTERRGVSGHSIDEPVPILFNLSSWDTDSTEFTDFLEIEIAQRFQLNRNAASRLVRDGYILPVLDGLDEMDYLDGRRRSSRAVDKINAYIASASYPRLVLVSRSEPKFYARLARRVHDAVEISVQMLDSRQIIEYVTAQCTNANERNTWKPVFNALQGSTHANHVCSVLGTPWRLTAAVTFYLNGGNPAELVPSVDELHRTSGLPLNYHERVRNLLMQEFLAARVSLHRRRGISPDDSVRWLRKTAQQLGKEGIRGASHNMIVLHDWWRVFDQRKIGIRHSLLLWFAATQAPFIPFSLLSFPHSTDSHGGVLTGLGLIFNLATITIYASRRLNRVDPKTLRLRNLSDPHRLRFMILPVVLSTILGYLGSVVFPIPYGIALAVMTGVIGILAIATSNPSAYATRPLGVIRSDRNYNIILAMVVAIYAVLYYAPIYGPQATAILSSGAALAVMASSTYARYIVSLHYGFRYGLPFRFARFLRWSHSAGILRISGIGYQFRHQELLDYLRS